MKKFFLLLLLFVFYNTASYSQKSSTGLNIDIKYARFYFHPMLSDSFLTAEVTYYFAVTSVSDSLFFDFSGDMNVDSVFFNGNKLQPEEFYQTPDYLVLKTALNFVENDSVSIFYHGYPGNYPQKAYFLSKQNTNDSIPVLWTLSEPYGAMTWYPCKQNLSDKIDSIDIYIEHPQGYTAVSNGLMVGETVSGENVITHWHHSYPIETYLIAIAVSKYYKYEITFIDTIYQDTFPVENYIYPEMVADTSNIDFVTQFIQFYTEKFGRYPFRNEKYGQVVCEIQGGMEHQTATFLSSIYNFELVSHELAHQWFGDYVTCKSWHDIWLNEGFATYLTGLCYERFTPDQYWMPWKDLTLRTVFLEDGGSVYCDDTTSIDRIFDGRLSYRKAAYLLHMIRWEIGDSAFFSAIRNYLADTSLAYGYATTDDLKHYFEVAGDTDLTEFFNDWFYGQGYPIYDINWNKNGEVLSININQGWSYEDRIFDITLPLVIWHSGEDSTILIDMHDYSKSINISLPYDVDSVVFDPDLWILAPHENVVHNLIELQTRNNVKVWPVPFSNSLYISANAGSEVMVYDEKGRKIAENDLAKTKIIKFNTNNWQSGVYVVKVYDKDGNIVVKNVIKVR
jgi:aminopeptidase N